MINEVNWSDEEDIIIKETLDYKHTSSILPKLNNKSHVDVHARRGFLYNKISKATWFKEEIEFFKNNPNLNLEDFIKLMPHRSERGIKKKLIELDKIKIIRPKPWTKKDDEKLKEVVKRGGAISLLKEEFPDRNKSLIYQKIKKLKLNKKFTKNSEKPKKSFPDYIKKIYQKKLNQNKSLEEFEFKNGNPEILKLILCEKNHIEERTIGSIYSAYVSKKSEIKCRICSKVARTIGYEESLEFNYPNIAKHYSKDNEKKASEILPSYNNKKVKWVCLKGHIIFKTPRIVTGKYVGPNNYEPSKVDEYICDDCVVPFILEDERFKKVLSNKNDLEKIKKIKINEKNIKIWFKCLKNPNHKDYEQYPYFLSRNFKNPNYDVANSCLTCNNIIVDDNNSLLKKRPDIAELIDLDLHKNLDLSKITFRSHLEYNFKCKDYPNLHKWKKSIDIMQRLKGTLCPFCKLTKNELGYRSPEILRTLLIALRDKLEFLTQQQKWVFFQQAGLLEGNSKFVNFAKAIISENLPISEIDKFIREEKSVVDKLIEGDSQDENKDNQDNEGSGSEEIGSANINDIDGPIENYSQAEDNKFNLPHLNSKDVLRTLSDTADLLQSDEESIKYLIVSGKDTLWKDVFEREDKALKEIKSFSGNKYIEEIKEKFLDEYNTAKSFTLPKEYSFKIDGKIAQPNLMQWLVATRIIKNKRIGNFSGTGAGKTLSAVLAVNISKSKLVVITCPNAVCEGWDREIKSIFPNTKTSIKGFDDKFKKYSGQKYLILNYEYFQQQDSAEKVKDILNLGKIDFIIIDEIHYSKQRTADNVSRRKEMVKNLVVEGGNKNVDLKVLGMSATPVINNLYEGKTMIELITGKSYDDIETEPNVPNCMKVYQQLAIIGTRWLPEYDIQFHTKEISINVDEYLDEIKEKVTKKNVLALEQILTKAKIPTIIENLSKKTIIYTHLVTGIVDVLREEITKAGYSVAQYTGEDKTGLKEFIEGDADILIGSSSISTGVDGLQHVCQKIIVNILPWTNAEYEQLKGRVFRQGQTKPVEIVIPITNLNINGEEKSWCKSRLSRIKFKKTLADAAVDGVIPEENFRTEQQVLDDLMKWIDRLSENKILAFDRKPLVSSLFSEDKKEINKRLRTYGDFSALNRKWNTGKSENTHKRLQQNNEEWVHYHELYREARQSWVKTPYQELINYYDRRDGLVIGDFGCGEAKIAEALYDKHKVHSFDHIAINEDVIECDIAKTPLEDECLDVAIFSLALMGSNFKDYIKEAHRTLKLDGRIHIIESASRFKDLVGFEKSLKQYGFDFITSSEMWKFTHIRGEKSTRPFNKDISINF